jgi:hypothetical protein
MCPGCPTFSIPIPIPKSALQPENIINPYNQVTSLKIILFPSTKLKRKSLAILQNLSDFIRRRVLLYRSVITYTVKKGLRTFPSPAGMSITELSMGKNVIKLFPPRESLGDGNVANLF